MSGVPRDPGEASSNGRTADFGSAYEGSNPSASAKPPGSRSTNQRSEVTPGDRPAKLLLVPLGTVPRPLLVAIGSALRLIPKHALPMGAAQVSRWDLPARMIVATTFVLALTGLAPLLGPQLSGLITPFPVFGTVLAAFAHRQQGAAAARNLLRGMTVSLLGVTGFMLAVGGLLTSLGIGWTYALAVVVVIVVNGLAFRMIR